MADINYVEQAPDAAQYLQLFETTGWNSTYRADAAALDRSLRHSHYLVAAYDGETLVGVGRVVSDGVLYAMIYDMIVAPSHQGRGIGTQILSMLVEKCRSDGIREIQLFSARGKAPFYRKRGFVERPPDGPGMRWVGE
jgi:GNAT superfamily N-acetyltransferase